MGKKFTKHIAQCNTLLHKINVIREVQMNTMEMSKKEVIISSWQNHKRFLEGGVFEIDAQERVGLADMGGKARYEQNCQERKHVVHQPYFLRSLRED